MNKRFASLWWGVLLLCILLMGTGCAADADGDRIIMGDSQVIRADETVNGDLLVVGGNVVVEEGATVNGEAVIVGGNVTLNGTVTGDVAVIGGSLERREGSVKGEVAVIGGSESFNESEGETVEVPDSEPAPQGAELPQPPERPDAPALPERPEFERPERPIKLRASPADRFFSMLLSIIGTLINTVAIGAIALVVTMFMPEHVRRTSLAASNAPAATGTIGCLAMPGLLFLGGFLAITIIGIPFALLLWAGALVAGLLGWIAVGMRVGDRLLRAADVRAPRPAAAAAVGAAGLYLGFELVGAIELLNLLGGIGWLAVASVGLGAALMTRGGTQNYPLPRLAGPVAAPAFDPMGAQATEPRPTRDLFADLAADLGLDEDDLRDDGGPKPERPVPPPER